VADVLAVTDVVVTGNVVLDEPAGTVTVAGTPATVELDARLITRSPAGATPVRVMVPTDEFPPTTEDGDTDTAWRTVP